jgi:bifunctional non-homologous end joining protein LigD
MYKPLAEYNAKRDFRRTAEPAGKVAKKSGKATGNSFVIQKHAASRLHYDFRLELDGVLKSWAVAKGPSLVPGEKRLAVHVEDHPLGYGTFEGTIPQGEYGGGTVMLWDRGTWEPEGDPSKDYEKGRLTFALHGEKLHGTWHLVRMRSRPGERRENWLLIKSDDEWARPAEAPDILEEEPFSVATGRTMDEIAAGKLLGAKVWRSKRKPKRKAAPAKRRATTVRAPRKAARAS